jgi:hypothetical protein
MSAADVWEQYDQQATLFSQLTAIGQSLSSISDILDCSSIQFDNANRKMNECYEAVVQANIVVDGFSEYIKMLGDNVTLAKKAYDDTENFIDPLLKNAKDLVVADLEIVQKYAEYLCDKYYYGIEMETAGVEDWEKDYFEYTGEKKYEL